MLERLLSKAKGTASEADRTAVVYVVMARTGLSREEASKRVAGWEATAQEARAKAEQAAEQGKQKAAKWPMRRPRASHEPCCSASWRCPLEPVRPGGAVRWTSGAACWSTTRELDRL